ncbi:MAG: 6-bladed beta-propeller [Bacteroidales bacterium]
MKKLIILFAVVITACNSNRSSKTIIDLDKTDEVSIFDLVDSISVVQLETTKESLLKGAYILSHKNRYYAFDRDQQVVICFDNNGKFLFKLNKKGRGVGEYNYVSSFQIDPYNDYLLLDAPWGVMYSYDLDGNFISKTIMSTEARAYDKVFAADKDRLLYFTFNYKFNAFYYSRSSKQILEWFIPRNEEIKGTYYGSTYQFNDSIYLYKDVINNEVLNLTDPQKRVAYKLDFGKHNSSITQINDYEVHCDENMKNLKSRDEIFEYFKESISNPKFPHFRMSNIFESTRFRIFFMTYKTWPDNLYLFYDKSNGTTKIFRQTTEGILFKPGNIDKNTIIAQPKNETAPLMKILKPHQIKILNDHNPENDNPLLVIYHFK